MNDELRDQIQRAVSLRLSNGRHRHHRSCIHNLPPEEQVAVRGRTVEQWMALHGEMPAQITPDDWEIDDPFATGRTNRSEETR